MSSTNFRRGQSRVYYASDVWDPGLDVATDEEFARTSFRSSCSELSEDIVGNNNEDYVASLLRRNNQSLSEEDFEENFLPPTYAKPLPLLGHPSRHSVLNR